MTTPTTLLALATAILSGSACSDDNATIDAEPVHVAVVCVDGIVHCDRAARERVFQQWLGEALDRPHSTFSVWVAGPTPADRRRQFAAEVPETWGGSVMEKKADFAAEARRRATADSADELQQSVVAPASERIVLVGGHGAADAEPGRVAAHAVVICDRSNSTLGISCDGGTLSVAIDAWARTGGREAGATWSLLVPGSSRDTTTRPLSYQVPDGSPGERAAFVAGVEHEVIAWEHTATRDGGSAIVEAVDVASEGLSQRKGAKQLVLLSDLRQVTPHTWNFEAVVPEASRFIAWLDRKEIRPEFASVVVTACGLHHQRGPKAGPFSAESAKKLRAVWQAVFARAGADDVRLQNSCVPDAE